MKTIRSRFRNGRLIWTSVFKISAMLSGVILMLLSCGKSLPTGIESIQFPLSLESSLDLPTDGGTNFPARALFMAATGNVNIDIVEEKIHVRTSGLPTIQSNAPGYHYKVYGVQHSMQGGAMMMMPVLLGDLPSLDATGSAKFMLMKANFPAGLTPLDLRHIKVTIATDGQTTPGPFVVLDGEKGTGGDADSGSAEPSDGGGGGHGH